jgi:hypothetical protein
LFAEANGQSKIAHCEYPVMRVHNLSHQIVASKSIRARPLEPQLTFSCCEEPVSAEGDLWLFLRAARTAVRPAEVDRFARLRRGLSSLETHVGGGTTMSNSKDEKPLGKSLEQDKSYAVGNKKPPVEHQFKKGVSGNLKGRPKGGSKEKALGDLGDLVMKDFYKPVWVNINGKTVKKSPAEIFAQHMVKDAIKKGAPRLSSCLSS